MDREHLDLPPNCDVTLEKLFSETVHQISH